MRHNKPPRTEDTVTGQPFVYNGTTNCGGWIVPSRATPSHTTYLHPSRVPLPLLRALNPKKTLEQCVAMAMRGAVI